MTSPERIWAFYSNVFGAMWTKHQDDGATEYVRRDPAVLAELPEVRDLMRRAYAAGWDAYHAQQQADWTDTRGIEQTREADLDAIREGRG